MASRSVLVNRIQYLEQQLRERDRADIARRAAAAEVSDKIAADKAAAEREAARLAEAQAMRRNAWVNHLLVSAPKGRPLDVNAIEAAIPAGPDAWPPGFDQTLVGFGTTPTPAATTVENTTLGKLQKGETL